MVMTINLETFSYDDTNSKLRGSSVININVFRHNKRYLCLWRSFRDRTWVWICPRLDWSHFLLPASTPSPVPRSHQGQSQRWWAAGGSFYLFVNSWPLFISGPQSVTLFLSFIFVFFKKKNWDLYIAGPLFLSFWDNWALLKSGPTKRASWRTRLGKKRHSVEGFLPNVFSLTGLPYLRISSRNTLRLCW